MSIRPLPDDVVAQIKSSTAIVSLTAVVLELVKNALDASAQRIHVSLDFVRGACTVEDDGLGIPPAEFSEHGGLGKLYCTSKYQADQPQLGHHGTFLASLAAVSLLTITSHHHAYRSHNSISFHHAQPIQRQTPTPAHNHVHGKSGSRVVVRNLFGNMPVRVKQRAATDQKSEQLRLRESLKRDVVALLLSWGAPVSLHIRDDDNKTIANFNTTASQPRSRLSSTLHILTQASYISIDEWPQWVPASASTPALSITGAISLVPAPTKQTQFISFGLHPLSSHHGNELYDQVNRLFAMSSFGTIENDAIDEQERLRRQSDRRFKSDGYTNRQLKARKGVDRYPTFHLRVSLKDRNTAEDFIETEANLNAVLGVFTAMVTQWLDVHHFRPRKTAAVRDLDDSTQKRPASSAPTTSTVRVSKRTRLASAPVESSAPRSHAFADWSRIKSSKASFFTTQKGPSINPPFSNPPAASPQPNEDPHKDDTISWTDPTTGKPHLVNARTGSVVTQTDPSIRSNPKSLRLSPSVAATTPWLDGLLQGWDNPIFKPSEQAIPQMSLHDLERGHSCHSDAFSAGSSARLSKNALRSAEVISQVDNKFILVKMGAILVLIDQHAADERVQVEALLSNMCQPPQPMHAAYKSNLAHTCSIDIVILPKPLQFTVSPPEHAHLETFAAHFAAWGILYDTSSTVNERSVSVTALPPAISERCTADPTLLISFLRSTAWKYADAPPPAVAPTQSSWVKRIATCPPGLIDLVNSRACRSAIMFNDVLTAGECEALVERLSECTFPFMCAHGRPSMVPVGDMGGWGGGRDGDVEVEGGFVKAWKAWKVGKQDV